MRSRCLLFFLILLLTYVVHDRQCTLSVLVDIFPKCREDFNWTNYNPSGDVANQLTTLCCNFNQKYRSASRSPPFAKDCQLVTFYLDHIKNKKNDIHVNACCKYFFYKLWGLMKKYGCSSGDTKRCSEEMKNLALSTNNSMISTLFKQCSDYPNDLDDDLFQIFEKLDIIYNKLKILETIPDYSTFYDFKYWMQYLERFHNKYNDSFKQLLKNFNESYLKYVKGLKHTSHFLAKGFLQYLSVKDKTKGVLTLLEETSEIVDPAEIHSITDKNNDTDSGTQISTRISFLFFGILIIMFILHKYTPFSSYLQPRARRIRKLRERKNKEPLSIIDSYEDLYNELNEKEYDISYESI